MRRFGMVLALLVSLALAGCASEKSGQATGSFLQGLGLARGPDRVCFDPVEFAWGWDRIFYTHLAMAAPIMDACDQKRLSERDCLRAAEVLEGLKTDDKLVRQALKDRSGNVDLSGLGQKFGDLAKLALEAYLRGGIPGPPVPRSR